MNQMLSWRAKMLESGLNKNAKYLALYLSTHMNDWGESAFPAVGTIAGRTGMGERTIFRALSDLVAASWLVKQNRYREDGGQTTNNYIASHPASVARGPCLPDTPPMPGSHPTHAKEAPPPCQGGTHNSSSNSSVNSSVKEGIDPKGSIMSGKAPTLPPWTSVETVIGHLNAKTGKNFKTRHTNGKPTASGDLVRKRLAEHPKADLLAVIDRKVTEWGSDDKMHTYLRPATLFAATKCEQYIGELGSAPTAKKSGIQQWYESETALEGEFTREA